ncbi:tRNA guanosine(34) transglycosylase Tgt [Candidatus Parcubacteria bacterium]|nr:MAG: tRNA guanosine(34) transglycosylase Tgt [Candidatus Parcubacteria bacterium]
MLNIIKQSNITKARVTELKTPHGILKTPFFMPDATRAVLKGLSQSEIEDLGLPAMVVNTFHLYLQPGAKLIKKQGGVHKFMNTNIPLISDSGGFQVFSLIHRGEGKMGSINNERARFKSPIDGSWHELTPKKSIQIQMDLGTDMVICLDDCHPNDASEKKLDQAINRTIEWAKDCKHSFEEELIRRKINKKNRPLLIAVIQGAKDIDKREFCSLELQKIGFDGYGYGARPVDEEGNFLDKVMQATAISIPTNNFRFALGVGTPEDIVRSVLMGWDIFDCVIPTREGRHGRLFYFSSEKLVGAKGKVLKF